MAMYVNEQRNERSGHKEGKSKGEQGAYGSGEENQSAVHVSKPGASFKPAADVIGAEVVGSLEVPGGISIVKGASAPASPSEVKGASGRPQGGKIQKSKDAKDAGR